MTDDYSRASNGKLFINHMANWPRYVRDNPNDTGAQMLEYALEEIDRLCKRGSAKEDWSARVLYAYVMTWRRFRWLTVPIPPPGPSSIGAAWSYIQTLNRWRKQHPDRGEP